MDRYVNTFFEDRVQQLFDLGAIVEKIFSTAGLDTALSVVWPCTFTSRRPPPTRDG
jgi:hypothetical protein